MPVWAEEEKKGVRAGGVFHLLSGVLVVRLAHDREQSIK
jgi:hypothetical protein